MGGGRRDDDARLADFQGAHAVGDLDARSGFDGFEFTNDPVEAALGHRGIGGVGDSLDRAAAEGVADIADEEDDGALSGVFDAGPHRGNRVRVDGAVPQPARCRAARSAGHRRQEGDFGAVVKGSGPVCGDFPVHGNRQPRPEGLQTRVRHRQPLDQVGDRAAVRELDFRFGTADGVQGGSEAQHPYDQDAEG